MAVGWTNQDLIDRCIFFARRPSGDAEMSKREWYELLTLAQEHWYDTFSVHVPEVLYGTPAQLSTADSGATYTFPGSIHPIGPVEVRAARDSYLLIPSTDWNPHGDFVHEGNLIRMPHGETRTFDDGPYARFITPPDKIDENTPPTLNPPRARILLVYRALVMWASRGAMRDPTTYEVLEQKAWTGDPDMDGDVGIMGGLKRQFFAAGMVSSPAIGRASLG
ncbi:hypothetical protein LCGC14_2780410 [marine sediment metagenome]|uniref:Uncharacterized protein n=1 Tax=marine sediment metagenome TaxID=412755 RepID=A0A0F8YTF1_9ZZZZ